MLVSACVLVLGLRNLLDASTYPIVWEDLAKPARLVWRTARPSVSRDPMQPLRQLGASPEIIGLKGTMSALFLKDLARKTHRGLEGRVRQGKAAGGLSYGYRLERAL